MSKPICVHCRKAYGVRRTENVILTWKEGEKEPSYRGDNMVVRVHTHANTEQLDKAFGRPRTEIDRWAVLETWNGESYRGGYRPFCTLRCALDFARLAYAKSMARVLSN
jgi:hypothetical protein